MDQQQQGQRLLAAMNRDLHDLCQPLTALQCRLELGRMGGDRASLREAVDGGLEEMLRIYAAVARMRSSLVEEDARTVRLATAESSPGLLTKRVSQ
jgi:hypothetical protein